ncbi:MAG: hypothetical protein WCE62_07070 [Polyangiales bacterium]
MVMYHYVIGVGAFLLLSTVWIGVQRAWRRSFPDEGGDPDVLAGRSRCHGCSEPADCHRTPDSGACEAQKEMP